MTVDGKEFTEKLGQVYEAITHHLSCWGITMTMRPKVHAVEIRAKTVLVILLFLTAFLVFADLVGVFFTYSLDHDYVYGLVPLFDLNSEANIPTFYSAAALLFSAILLGLISHGERNRCEPWFYWAGLSGIFVFLSLDEFASIHELLNEPVREALDTGGHLFFAWVIPYSVLGLVFLIVYARFLLRLPRRIAGLFILSGTIFVTGAVGLEMLGASMYDSGLRYSISYALCTTAEELLEMVGVALFIYALLLYSSEYMGEVSITLSR